MLVQGNQLKNCRNCLLLEIPNLGFVGTTSTMADSTGEFASPPHPRIMRVTRTKRL